MIEQEIIKQYPSLVARPYLLIKDDFQRKDMQRFWFENTISFLAVLSAAELVKFYKSLKSKEKKSEKDLEMIHTLQENKSLTMVGLEHMALGKWVMMLRETTKALQALQDLNAASTIPELVEFYHGKNGKKNAKLIDKFVSIRNDDAHGNPIPEEKLKTELDSRQKLIDSLLEELSFLKNYFYSPKKLKSPNNLADIDRIAITINTLIHLSPLLTAKLLPKYAPRAFPIAKVNPKIQSTLP